MDIDKLKDQLIEHEGMRLLPYTDTVGKLTIGVGWNLTDNGLPEEIVFDLLDHSIDTAKQELDRIYPEWCELSEARQHVLLDMCFNLGAPRYLTFSKFWAALRQGQWDLAADEMIDSRWANQVGDRAVTLSNMMREG